MKHIRTKFLIVFLALTFATLFVMGWLVQYEIEAYFQKWFVNHLELQLKVVLAAFERESGSDISFAKIIADAGKFRITIIARDGKVLYDSEVQPEHLSEVETHLHRPEIEKASKLGSGTDIRVSNTVHHSYLYFAQRIEPAQKHGLLENAEYLRLSIPLTEMQKAISEISKEILLVGIAVMILMILASIGISRNISKPLIDINKAVREIQNGNLDQKIDIPNKDEIGQVAQAINSMVSQLKDDIVRLKKLERVRSEFLGNVSHELRTPIFMLQGYLETLLDGALDDPNVNREFIEKAYGNALRLNTLLGDLIEISRIESGEMRMSFRYFRIGDLIESVAEEFRSQAQMKNISLSVDYDGVDRNQEVYGDKERLGQALRNLVDNAIKYTQPNGSVRIVSRDKGDAVNIEVIDTGIGIPEEHIERIFERFYRVDKERSREAGGTGLGLSIVKHIIEAHSSKVIVTSEVGKGSTFSFSLKK
ncbi:MAG TPA: ATP-binding protein [Bacteroidota bacterium]|nr:ATP-binding protein [Bacteroidota bacterium]